MIDKGAMRARLQEHAVAQPRFTVLTDSVEPAWGLGPVGPPRFRSRSTRAGQRGVYRITNDAELAEHLPRTLAHSRSKRAVLEQFIDGHELNGIVVARDGNPTLLTLSDRLRPPGAGFGWVYLYPSLLDKRALETAAAVALDAARAWAPRRDRLPATPGYGVRERPPRRGRRPHPRR